MTGVQTCALPICATVGATILLVLYRSCAAACTGRIRDLAAVLHQQRRDIGALAGRERRRYGRNMAVDGSGGGCIGLGRPSPVDPAGEKDRKSTRLNSSHALISYAVFCLKKKKKNLG